MIQSEKIVPGSMDLEDSIQNTHMIRHRFQRLFWVEIQRAEERPIYAWSVVRVFSCQRTVISTRVLSQAVSVQSVL